MTKQFYLHRTPRYADSDVRAGNMLIAQVACAPGAEADLALCLSALVAAGYIDHEKLKAALVLAEPVAREKVAEATRRGA